MTVARHDSKRMLVATQIGILMNQQPITKDVAAGLQKLHDTTHECLYALQNLDVKTEHWDDIVAYVICQRLDKETAMLYEQSLTNPKEKQPLHGLLGFIEQRFMALSGLQNKPDKMGHQKHSETAV